MSETLYSRNCCLSFSSMSSGNVLTDIEVIFMQSGPLDAFGTSPNAVYIQIWIAVKPEDDCKLSSW